MITKTVPQKPNFSTSYIPINTKVDSEAPKQTPPNAAKKTKPNLLPVGGATLPLYTNNHQS